ncbi:MAG: hypothetical protein ACKO33_03635 [Bacteroidota bacterium]
MIPAIRQQFNNAFTEKQYQLLLNWIEQQYPSQLDFRVAETPLFISKQFTKEMLDTCQYILSVIQSSSFTALTAKSIPHQLQLKGNEGNPLFLAFDFGICKNGSKQLSPQLIEIQGFPSLFAYQAILDEAYRATTPIPVEYTTYLSQLNPSDYKKHLKNLLLGNHKPAEVILLELFPEKQKTRIDFVVTEEITGIKTICITKLIRKDNQLFYYRGNELQPIKRIYNRLIFDELLQQPAPIKAALATIQGNLAVEWCIHPHWFYRISKYTLPFLHHPNIPPTYFLHEIKQLPTDLENYVLKPLFSFAGQGVVLDITKPQLEKIQDPENWILQKKVSYADCIETPNGFAKAEIRLFYWWLPGGAAPIPVNNLGRISKGAMIGTRYNLDKTWVGGTCCYFEQ